MSEVIEEEDTPDNSEGSGAAAIEYDRIGAANNKRKA